MTYPLLDAISSPKDLKKLSVEDLATLATEIRKRIIEVLAVNGGHLASNLGSVELTIALHAVFNSPKDKFIFDVSHQSYTHKLLTGRNSRFSEISKYGGLCGFTNPNESNYDHFHAGHAGTALSLSLGVAHTRNLEKRGEYVIPVIGDATLTCGVSLEALNNLPPNLKKFIVILNDNAMSISKNVGAITQILSRLISNPTTHKIYQELHSMVSKIPSVGPLLSKQGKKITGSIKSLVSPAAFFEQYGLSYIGPIDGHDIKKLIDTFERLKDSEWPVIIHLLTKKGKGLEAAIQNPASYHGVKPFDPKTGEFIQKGTKKTTFPKIFGQEILDMAKRDKELVAVTPAMPLGSCLDPLMEEFPDRCLDVGIAEGHSVTFSGGLAYGKQKKVVTSIYATFLQRAFDNLFHDVCLQELPVLFAIDRAGLAAYGGTHHGIYDISFLNAMPNMIISQPRNGQVLRDLFFSAFSWGQPAAIRYPNFPTDPPKENPLYRDPGKAEVLEMGSEILIISLGNLYTMAQEIREILLKEGYAPTLVDPVFLKPLDEDLFSELLLTHKTVVTIEEHSLVCGMGALFNNFVAKRGFSGIELLNFGVPDRFIEHGPISKLYEEIGLTAPNIAKQVLEKTTKASLELAPA